MTRKRVRAGLSRMKFGIATLALIGIVLLMACQGAPPDAPGQAPASAATPVVEATTEPSPTPTPIPSPTPSPSPTPAPPYLEGWIAISGASSLERAKPELAEMIIGLPWVSDGISTSEGEFVGHLVNAAMLDEPVFLAVIDRPWVVDGLNGTEQGILRELGRFNNRAVASLIPDMPFMETVEPEDSSTMSRLLTLDSQAPRLLSAITELTWVGDGISGPEPDAIRWLRNFNDANVALSVIALGWVQDGIKDSETDAIEELSYIDQDDSAVAASIVALPWVQDGVQDTEFEAIDWINNFGGGEAAAALVALPWVQDGIEGLEVKTIEELSYIDYADSEVAETVIAFPWVQDGVSEVEFGAIDWINHFGAGKVIASVVQLGWVQDGIDELEVKAIEDLSDINYYDSAVAASVVALPWIQDGILELEGDALPSLDYMNYIDSTLAASVVALPWMQDSIEAIELEAIDWLNNEKWGPVIHVVVQLPWIQDGVNELELDAISNLYWITDDDVTLAQSVVALPWMLDSITSLENRALDEISWFTEEASQASTALVALPWVQDGLTPMEVDAIDWLNAFKDPDTALQIVSMPFLETLEPADSMAVQALGRMATWEEDHFQGVMAHPILSGGITDRWAKIVATLYGVSDTNPALIDALLDPQQVTVEERTIDLPLAGETHLAIIRTGPGAERSMDLLEHAVRQAEEYMAEPFPTGYVGYLFGDAVPSSFGGANWGTHIASLAEYDVDDGSGYTDFTGNHLAHEVAHYYWYGNAEWVDEGVADFMASVSENARIGTPVEVTNDPCGYVRTIAELEALNVSSEAGADSAFTCNYSLGERLFMDLYRNLGEERFREGLRELYLLSREVQENTEDDTDVGIEHVKAAFRNEGESDNSPADLIANRWYDGTGPFVVAVPDTRPVIPHFLSISGQMDAAYIRVGEGGPPIKSISAANVEDWVQVYLDYSYSVGRSTEVPLEIVTYFEDGFVFDRKVVTFTAKPRYIGGWWGVSVGASPDSPWPLGTYHVYVYNEGRKLVELQYEVTE